MLRRSFLQLASGMLAAPLLTPRAIARVQPQSPLSDHLARLARGVNLSHMWDYSGGFALAIGEPGKRILDKKTLRAIGMEAFIPVEWVPPRSAWCVCSQERRGHAPRAT